MSRNSSGSSDSCTNKAVSAPLQFSESVIQSFRQIWEDTSQRNRCIFAIIDLSASANGYFQQLKVSDAARLRAELQKCSTTWRDGHVVYIGALLFDDAETSAMKKLLEATKPPVEPVLSLIISVNCGLACHHQMTFPLFMPKEHKPEVSASQQQQ